MNDISVAETLYPEQNEGFSHARTPDNNDVPITRELSFAGRSDVELGDSFKPNSFLQSSDSLDNNCIINGERVGADFGEDLNRFEGETVARFREELFLTQNTPTEKELRAIASAVSSAKFQDESKFHGSNVHRRDRKSYSGYYSEYFDVHIPVFNKRLVEGNSKLFEVSQNDKAGQDNAAVENFSADRMRDSFSKKDVSKLISYFETEVPKVDKSLETQQQANNKIFEEVSAVREKERQKRVTLQLGCTTLAITSDSGLLKAKHLRSGEKSNTCFQKTDVENNKTATKNWCYGDWQSLDNRETENRSTAEYLKHDKLNLESSCQYSVDPKSIGTNSSKHPLPDNSGWETRDCLSDHKPNLEEQKNVKPVLRTSVGLEQAKQKLILEEESTLSESLKMPSSPHFEPNLAPDPRIKKRLSNSRPAPWKGSDTVDDCHNSVQGAVNIPPNSVQSFTLELYAEVNQSNVNPDCFKPNLDSLSINVKSEHGNRLLSSHFPETNGLGRTVKHRVSSPSRGQSNSCLAAVGQTPASVPEPAPRIYHGSPQSNYHQSLNGVNTSAEAKPELTPDRRALGGTADMRLDLLSPGDPSNDASPNIITPPIGFRTAFQREIKPELQGRKPLQDAELFNHVSVQNLRIQFYPFVEATNIHSTVRIRRPGPFSGQQSALIDAHAPGRPGNLNMDEVRTERLAALANASSVALLAKQ